MNQTNATSGTLNGSIIFVGLLPLAYSFSPNGTQLLLDTSFKFIIWGAQATILLLILIKKPHITKGQLMSYSMLYLLTPFAFTFNAAGITFLILTKYPS